MELALIYLILTGSQTNTALVHVLLPGGPVGFFEPDVFFFANNKLEKSGIRLAKGIRQNNHLQPFSKLTPRWKRSDRDAFSTRSRWQAQAAQGQPFACRGLARGPKPPARCARLSRPLQRDSQRRAEPSPPAAGPGCLVSLKRGR